ncbi:predicted protein, partial [Thalassiosira pseudonana CCMP1335]
LLLGSASFTRKLILSQMNIPYHVVVRPIDERTLGDRTMNANPEELVLLLANAKMDKLLGEIEGGGCDGELSDALEVSSASGSELDDKNGMESNNDSVNDNEKEWIILTGDQVVTCQNRILEKPTSISEAKQFVSLYATHPPSTVGSVVLTHFPSGIRVEGVRGPTDDDDSRPMDLVDRLLEQDAPILSCAGGLMIEHPLVQEHVERIDGTEDSVMGLSKDLVVRLL